MTIRYYRRPGRIPERGLFRLLRVMACCACLAGSVYALPPMLPIADRFSGSGVVVLAEISEVTRKRFNDISESVSMRVRVERSFKGSAPDDFYMAFLVFPQTFEQHLRKPVGDGRYFLFLNHKQVSDGTGVTGEALVLFEPRPFAFLPYSAEALKEIQSLTGAAGENQ